MITTAKEKGLGVKVVKYTTIPTSVVDNVFNSVTPVTISYLKEDGGYYICNIKELSIYRRAVTYNSTQNLLAHL